MPPPASAMPDCRPTVLVILDGVGINPSPEHNALAQARTPNLDRLFAEHPYTTLEASGPAVGLPDGQMGNSEVGHVIMGCGDIVVQDLVRIDRSIADGSFFRLPALRDAARRAVGADRPLHLLGLASGGGVHSHLSHLLALIELAGREGAEPRLHLITDGRDVPPRSALADLAPVEAALAEAGGAVASVCGRFYAMDRDRRWERTRRAFEAAALARAEHRAASAREAVEAAYARGEDDEFIAPALCPGAQPLDAADTVVFFNFRNDRPRQLAAALAARDFPHFERGAYRPPQLTTMTAFDPELEARAAFGEAAPAATLAETVSRRGIAQLRCAETEKYPHVTFFFNGGREEPWPGEQRAMLPSPDVETYDQAPRMNAAAVADAVIDGIRSGQYGFILVNFANGDMVGHTARPEAVIAAVECLDAEVGRVVDAAREHGHALLLTADHGNCDLMVDAQGRPHTQHTAHPVPCVVVDREPRRLRAGGGLGNVAPTVLELMGLERPAAMPLPSLLDG